MRTGPDVYTIPLGVSAALPDRGGANSYLTVVRDGRYWLVDCADSPIQHLQTAGLDPLAVEGLFITHFHPDHVYGLPSYALGLHLLAKERGYAWSGRQIPICARPEVLSDVKALLGLFSSQGWVADLPFVYREIPAEIGALVSDTPDFRILVAPTCHSVPSMAIRFELPGEGRAFVYSGDTAPCQAVETLARGASLLIHEAAGEGKGHANAHDVGELAARAEVAQLALIHYDARSDTEADLLAKAGKSFGGAVSVAEPYHVYPW